MLQQLLRRLVFDVPQLTEYCKMPINVSLVNKFRVIAIFFFFFFNVFKRNFYSQILFNFNVLSVTLLQKSF